MARLRTLTLALAAGALLSASAPPALAADDSRHYGNCGFTSSQDATMTQQSGEIHAAVVVYSATHGNVVNATVTCEIRVDGVPAASASGSGSGVIAFAEPLSYAAESDQYVELCTIVDYTSDWTPTTVDCPGAMTLEFPPTLEWPPQWITDVQNLIWYTVDPYVCEALKLAAPGAGPVAIDGQGDVYLYGELVYDCPPYVFPMPPPPSPAPTTLSGAGYNDGSSGFLTLFTPAVSSGSPNLPALVSTCAFTTSGGVGTVTGRTDAPGADASSIGCRLEDAATGTVLYDATASSATGSASLSASIAVTGPLTVCTQGSATFGTTTKTVGRHCRPGLPV